MQSKGDSTTLLQWSDCGSGSRKLRRVTELIAPAISDASAHGLCAFHRRSGRDSGIYSTESVAVGATVMTTLDRLRSRVWRKVLVPTSSALARRARSTSIGGGKWRFTPQPMDDPGSHRLAPRGKSESSRHDSICRSTRVRLQSRREVTVSATVRQ
jgi:hypothetical protein